MKVAVSVDGNRVSAHFGRCEKYVIFEKKDGKEIARKEIPNPGHEPFYLPKFLSEKGVKKIITCGIGPKAAGLFGELGIEVVAGVEGNVDETIGKYLEGKLKGGAPVCQHTH